MSSKPPAQLTLDGRETRHPPARPVKPRPLSDGQQRIISVIKRRGQIRSVEAGVILHQMRGHCAFNTRPHNWPMRGQACCPYASSDGLAACKRMLERGIIIRGPRQGTWILKPKREEPAA